MWKFGTRCRNVETNLVQLALALSSSYWPRDCDRQAGKQQDAQVASCNDDVLQDVLANGGCVWEVYRKCSVDPHEGWLQTLVQVRLFLFLPEQGLAERCACKAWCSTDCRGRGQQEGVTARLGVPIVVENRISTKV